MCIAVTAGFDGDGFRESWIHICGDSSHMGIWFAYKLNGNTIVMM